MRLCDAGVQLMAGRWEGAVKAVLGSHGSQSPAIDAARKLFWETNDAAAAAKAMPRHMHAEVACLQVCTCMLLCGLDCMHERNARY